MSGQQSRYCRVEPIFNLKTPLLFAHRGGALEVPESTVKGFRHAIENARSDVLELDVQLTRDGELVVWHGPDLDNVRIDGQNNCPAKRPKKRRKIYHYEWKELDGKAWVADPRAKTPEEDEIDLSGTPVSEDRRLLLLSDFLDKFPNIPLNIEMKQSFKRKIDDANRAGSKDNIRLLTGILDNDSSKRKIVIVSAHDGLIDEFRELNGEKYPTGLSIREQLAFQFFDRDMRNRVLETSYDHHFSGRKLIERAARLGGATFVFLTGFGPVLPAIDNPPKEEEIFEVLDRGVDGIMTDRPKRLREIIDKWQALA